MIGYYIHHHGYGHLARAMSIGTRLTQPVTALTSLSIADPHPFAAVVPLPRDDQSCHPREVSAHGAFHWAPHHDDGYSARMNAVARWVAQTRPSAFVTDVSVEVAAFVRLLGVPVIVVALPGDRRDAPHLFAHRMADHIIAAWPREVYVPPWLQAHSDKTSFVGAISRFDGQACPASKDVAGAVIQVLVLAGASEDIGATVGGCERACPGTAWTTIGGVNGSWANDPWPHLCAADVVVTHAGQGAVADIAAAQRRAIVLPASRPFDEQAVTADILRRYGLATVPDGVPDERAWPGLIAQAMAGDPPRWTRWQVSGAADRAAFAIESTAQRCATVGAP